MSASRRPGSFPGRRLTCTCTPSRCGSAVVDAAGTVTMTVKVPAWVQPGSHTLQFVGYQGESATLAMSTGIEVSSPLSTSAGMPQGAASSRAVVSFLPGAIILDRSAKAAIWVKVNRVRSGSAAAPVACTEPYRPPAGSHGVELWQQRLAGINDFLTRAGCGTITTVTGSLTGVTGRPEQTVRVTAATGQRPNSRHLPGEHAFTSATGMRCLLIHEPAQCSRTRRAPMPSRGRRGGP